MCSSFLQKHVTSMHRDQRKCRRLTCRAEQGPWGKQKEPGCQHGNGESLATHEDGCLRRGEGERFHSQASNGRDWVFARGCYTQRAGWYERGALERKSAPDAGQHEERLWNVVTLSEIRFSVVSSDARRERLGFLMVRLAPQQSLSLGAIRITYLPDGEFSIPPAVLYPQASAEHWSAYAHLIGKDGRLISNAGAHVIQPDAQTLLVDAGVGPRAVNIDEL